MISPILSLYLMKHLFYIAGMFLLLVMMLTTGCDHAPRYDQRLVQADSLMQPDPDSALAIVEAVNRDSLTNEGDRAYCDLLLTQATYKAYQDITLAIDSAISSALDHYRRYSGEREKLTRTYLYKGAIMEELGHVDSAMYYYKHAEVSADENDHVNLGQINTRIAALYRMYYGDREICLDKYKRALSHYQKTGNKHLQQNCLYNISMCAAISDTEDSEKHISQSLELARELNDSAAIYASQELLCRILLKTDTCWRQAKPLALDCLHHYPHHINYDLILDLAKIYAIENKIDSAKYYLAFADENNTDKVLERKSVRVRKLNILELIARKEGDVYKSNYYSNWCRELTDTILNNKDRYNIQRIENESIHERDNLQAHRIGSLRWLALFLCLALITAIAVGAVYHYRRERNIKAIIRELKSHAFDSHDELREQLDSKSVIVERLISNLVELIKMCVARASADNTTSMVAQQIKETIVDVANDDFWTELRGYLDSRYNGIISSIARHPNISVKDLKFIELSCCGFSYIEIAIIMSYTPRYVINKRKIIAKKLGLTIPLQDYLQQAKENSTNTPHTMND